MAGTHPRHIASRTMSSSKARIAVAGVVTAGLVCAAAFVVAKRYVKAKDREREREREANDARTQQSFEEEQIRLKLELAQLAASGNLGAGGGEAGGGLVSLTPEQCGGKTDRYSWTQNEREIVVTFDVDAATTSRHVEIDIRTKSIRVAVRGEVKLEGELIRRVIVDDCLWEMEEAMSGVRRVKRINITLIKLRRTFAKFHWPSVCYGEPEINEETLNSFGDPVLGVNGSDSSDMATIMDEIRALSQASPRKAYYPKPPQMTP